MDNRFSKDESQVVNKQMKNSSVSLTIMEMQIKIKISIIPNLKQNRTKVTKLWEKMCPSHCIKL